jgi:hypothetical protein
MYREFCNTGKNNRILMASYRRCGNKLYRIVVAREIRRIRKDMNKDRRYMADI